MRRFPLSISRAAAAGAAALSALAVGFVPVRAEVEHHNGNAGDIWVDQAGAPSGPGHENDPQLSACSAVTVWGAGLADGGGTLTIEAIPPTPGGHRITLTWSFPGGRTARPLATVEPASLAALLTDANHGAHLRVVLEQDPRKSKDFWLSRCAASARAAAAPGGATGPAIAVPSTGVAPPPLSAVLLCGGAASLLLAGAHRRRLR